MPTPSSADRLKNDVVHEVCKGVDITLAHGPLHRGKDKGAVMNEPVTK